MARGSRSNPGAVRSVAASLWIVLVLSAPMARAAADSPLVTVAQSDFRFGKVVSGAVLAHAFSVKNEGSTPIRILRIQLTSPLVVTDMPAVIGSGSGGSDRRANGDRGTPRPFLW